MPPAHRRPSAHRRPRGRGGRLLATFAAAGLLAAGVPAVAYAAELRVDLKLLVVTDGRPNVAAVTAQLDREGVPYDLVDTRDAGRPTITPALLTTTTTAQERAKYQAVVLAHESALPPDELAALTAYEQRYHVRQLDAYTWAHPEVGLEFARWSGRVDGMTATVTDAAKATGFGYLAGPLPFDDVSPDVDESYAALATPGAGFTPFVTLPVDGGPPGSAVGVYAHDGREEMVVTVTLNPNQTHAKVLAHGIVEWLTGGVHLGHWRNWFSVHVDDIFLPDDRWDIEFHCTVGDDCNPTRDPNVTPYTPLIRMEPADVDALLAWQRANNLKLDMAFNGFGSDEAPAPDPLTAKLLAHRNDLRWISHTFTHKYLGCVQNFTVSPWQCATDPVTKAVRWVSRAEIGSEVSRNVAWARRKQIPLDASELVTGEHSGLRSLPHMPTDNPNLAPALRDTNVWYVASDASREPAARVIGTTRTVPRRPMNIFYNVATRAEEVAEYTWIYASKAAGGSGICEANPATSTCIPPLSGPADFERYIVPLEAHIALGDVVGNDPRPRYAHQSNLAEDRILYPVLDEVLRRYRQRYAGNAPLVNARMSEISDQLTRTAAWRAAVAAGKIEAYVSAGKVTVVNRTGGRLDMPVGAPAGTKVVADLLGTEVPVGDYGQPYGTGRSAWTSVAAGGKLLLRLPA